MCPESVEIEARKNSSNDFDKTWYKTYFGCDLSCGAVVDPLKIHYDVIIGG